MKILGLITLLTFFVSCAHEMRGPAAYKGPVAEDSLAWGNVRAVAAKQADNQSVCFDIELTLTGTPQEQASPSNWTVAWVDKQDHYHLVKLQQRDPASEPAGGETISPYGSFKQWTNSFRTCAPQAQVDNVKALVLTPKQLPYDFKDGLKLIWK